MPITFGRVKEIVAEYAGRGGKSPNSETVNQFAFRVLDYVRLQGTWGSIRKFCFIAQKGCFAAPPELDVPLKVRIDNKVGNIWSKWYAFHTVTAELDGCIPADKVLIQEPYFTPTQFDLPCSGACVAVLGTCPEQQGAELTVKGKDITGREVIFSYEAGEQHQIGERFDITQQMRVGQVHFGEITAISKSKTNGYVQLWAVDPITKTPIHLLADYSPVEELPQYRKFQVQSSACGEYTHVTILGRIRLREYYADNDIVPFDSEMPILLTAQRIQAEARNDIEVASYKRQAVKDFLGDEHQFKKTPQGSPVEVFYPLSAGAIKNINR
jgi:hypothetical protein